MSEYTITMTEQEYKAMKMLLREIDADDDVILHTLDNQTANEVEGVEFSQNIDGALAAIMNATKQ